MYIYIFICFLFYVCMYIYIYIYKYHTKRCPIVVSWLKNHHKTQVRVLHSYQYIVTNSRRNSQLSAILFPMVFLWFPGMFLWFSQGWPHDLPPSRQWKKLWDSMGNRTTPAWICSTPKNLLSYYQNHLAHIYL